MANGKLFELDEFTLNALLRDLDAYEAAIKSEAAQKNLIPFCQWMDPQYKAGKIHYMIAEKLEAIERKELLRLAIALAPRHGKSRLCSELFPAWFMGRNPTEKLMGASRTTDLAEEFGRKVRNLIDTKEFNRVFPDTRIRKDSSSAGRWATTANGEAYYAGVGTSIAGRGANLCLTIQTNIATTTGPRAIGDVEVGDLLITPYGRKRIVYKVLTIHSKAIKINGQLTASEEHPFFTQRGWVHAGQLRRGDRLQTLSIWRRTWNSIAFYLRPLLTRLGAVC